VITHFITLTGTNINEALLRAIFILNEANNLRLLDPNSVSLIILVSDGDPTVGKSHLNFFVTNVAFKNAFCLMKEL
jgi:inter-alpha-trypsin inhibitor heavy chain H2